MAQTARTEAGKATDNVAELGKRTADKGLDMAREAIDRTENTARRGLETAQRTSGAALEVERAVARRSAEGASEVGRAFAELVKEQARSNVEAFQALTRAVDWDQVSRIQGELLRASVERAAQFTRRYLEVVQAVTASGVSATQEQARKAARRDHRPRGGDPYLDERHGRALEPGRVRLRTSTLRGARRGEPVDEEEPAPEHVAERRQRRRRQGPQRRCGGGEASADQPGQAGGQLLERRIAGRHRAQGQAEAPPLSPASPASLRGADTRHERARPADQSERRWRAEADAAGTTFVRRSLRPLLRQAVRRYAPADAARRGTDRGAADRSETASTSSATSPGTAWWTMCPAPGTSRSSLPGISPWSRTACRPTSTTWSSVPATITTGIRRPR